MNAAQRKKDRTARELIARGRTADERIRAAEHQMIEAMLRAAGVRAALEASEVLRHEYAIAGEKARVRAAEVEAQLVLAVERADLADNHAAELTAALDIGNTAIDLLNRRVEELQVEDRDAVSLRRRLQARSEEVARLHEELRRQRAAARAITEMVVEGVRVEGETR